MIMPVSQKPNHEFYGGLNRPLPLPYNSRVHVIQVIALRNPNIMNW